MIGVRELAERVWFIVCLALGRLLRSARYSTVRIVQEDGELRVRKRRLFHAPLLVALGGPLLRMLDTGVRVLPRRDWEERERELHARVHGTSIRTDAGGTLVLPFLAGKPLAALLDDPALEESARTRAIGLAVNALADFHARGLTHGDAMAENVMVDLEAGVANWFDFETMHDSSRSMTWRRADDVRALLSTCLLRSAPEKLPGTLRLILDVYADEEVTRFLAGSFGTAIRRPLVFHLGQAELSLQCFREIDRLMREREWCRLPG